MFRENTLKTKLQRGEKPFGCWVFLAGGDTTELLSMMGFDALIIDHEHIFASPHELIMQMRAAQATDTTCLVRVPSHDEAMIKRVLDTGIEGIIVPTVETADQARAIAACCHYRPQGGHRGVGYPESRAANWGLAETVYPKHYRERLLVSILIETRKGVDNIEEIAAVDGIDMIFPGAGDLLADIVADFDGLEGYGGYDNAELMQMMGHIEDVVQASDKWLGGVTRGAASAREMLARGYDFVTPTADSWLLMESTRQVVDAMKS